MGYATKYDVRILQARIANLTDVVAILAAATPLGVPSKVIIDDLLNEIKKFDFLADL